VEGAEEVPHEALSRVIHSRLATDTIHKPDKRSVVHILRFYAVKNDIRRMGIETEEPIAHHSGGDIEEAQRSVLEHRPTPFGREAVTRSEGMPQHEGIV
jgi:hypothetical protein